jgi:cephalosporin hydroxylase
MSAPPTVTPGVNPMTVVETGATTIEAMEDAVRKTLTENGELLQQYHDVWYNAPHTWHYTRFLGVGMMKSPNDLWAYQDLLTEHRPKTIIETGTYTGASALWFAYLMDMLGIDGHVYTVDFEDRRKCQHPRITFLGGDSTDPELVASIAEQVEYPLLVSLDADHSAAHVKAELELYAPLCRVGDWLVVEDTNIAWTGEKGDPGARGGLQNYVVKHPGEWRQDPLCERWLLTMNPGGYLQRMAACEHT